MFYAHIVLTIRKQHLKLRCSQTQAILYCMWPICVGQYICILSYICLYIVYMRVYVYRHTYNYTISILC